MLRTIAFLIAAALVGAGAAGAQTYPDRPIHILVPYAPGGITDIAARLVGAKLSEAWGQQVVVENRAGGNGFIAMTTVIRSAPDGYTLVMASGGDLALNPALFKQMPYDVERDLIPITAVSDAPIVLAAHGTSSFKSVADVIAAAKAQPGAVNVATPGFGSITHLVLEWLALSTGTSFQHVPYKGGGPAAQGLVAGDVPLGLMASSSIAPHVSTGSVRILAVTQAKRSELNPEWPTLREQGVPDVNASNWTALLAPKGTPAAIVDRLNAEVVKILALPDVKQKFAAGGVEAIPSTGPELAARMQRELASFREVVAKAKMHPE